MRAKIAAGLLIVLFAVVAAAGALQMDRTTKLMVGQLGDSANLLIAQSFEQIRAILADSDDDPLDALDANPSLQALLNAACAFGTGVVYARIEGPNHEVLVSAPAGATPAPSASFMSFETLEQSLSTWRGLAELYRNGGPETFEVSRTFEIGGRPFGEIDVGLSTALVANELRRSLRHMVFLAGSALGLSILGAILLGRLVLRPVAQLATGVERLAEGDEPEAVMVSGGDELSSLAEKFNLLSERINQDRTRWERERGQFFNIFRSITDAVLLLDSEGKVLFANGEAAGRLGLPAGGVIEGKPLQSLLGADHPLMRVINTAFASGTEVHDVALQLGDSSDPLRLLVSISSLGHGPEPSGVLVIARDLEPVRELETVVDHSGRLARLAELVSGVAHQLRNPLNSMTLQLELLTQDAEQGRGVQPRVSALGHDIRRLNEAIDALMRFMKPQSLKLTEVALDDLLAEIAGLVKRPGIEVRTEFETPCTIVADRALLREAFLNLANNAVESMPDGGVLTLRTERKRGNEVEVSFKDQGHGIPPEQLDRIFRIYFTTKPGGSGLGLPLAARAIDMHHGTLKVESQVEVGTTFLARLPLAARDSEVAANRSYAA